MRALLVTLVALLLLATDAYADCNAAAYNVAAQYGNAQVIKVRQENGDCVITLLIQDRSDAPPRKKIVRVPG